MRGEGQPEQRETERERLRKRERGIGLVENQICRERYRIGRKSNMQREV